MSRRRSRQRILLATAPTTWKNHRLHRRLETRGGVLDDVVEQEPQEPQRGAALDEEGILDDVVEQEPQDPQ